MDFVTGTETAYLTVPSISRTA